MKQLLRRAGLVLGFSCLCAATALAQAVGIISGTVKDGTGAVIPGVTVEALNQGTGVTRDALTDESGHYALPLLPVGTY